MQVKHVLNEVYGIQEGYILDNNLCRYNPQIHELSFLSTIDCKDFFLILACTNADIYMNLKLEVEKYFNDEDIVELSSMSNITRIGKHSYGSLCCNHMLIESIGAFCSFAIGSEVVFNHEMRYITTSPIIYIGAEGKNTKKYEWYKNAPWYVEGLCPKKEKVKQFKRIRIGNDEKVEECVHMLREENDKATIVSTPWEQLGKEAIVRALEHGAELEDLLENHHEHHHHGQEGCCGHGHHEEDHCHEHHHHHGQEGCCGHGHHGHHHHADEIFTSWGKETAHKYTEEELDYLVKALSETEAYGKVLRSKGIVPMADGSWKQFDLVPEEYEVRDGQPDYTGRVCVIGTDLKEEELLKLFHI